MVIDMYCFTSLFFSNFPSSLKAFQKAAAEVVNLAVRPTDAELLEVYSLYKQVTVGNCNSGKISHILRSNEMVKDVLVL